MNMGDFFSLDNLLFRGIIMLAPFALVGFYFAKKERNERIEKRRRKDDSPSPARLPGNS